MKIKWSEFPKILGYAYSRLITPFKIRELKHSDIWHNPYTKFVLIAAPRTGSNWLVSMLNSHPEILCHYELFHWRQVYSETIPGNGYAALRERNRNPCLFLKNIYSNGLGKKAIGFKLFEQHNPAILDYLIRQPAVKKIILKRSNYLKIYSSHLIAKKTGAYTFKPETRKTAVYVDAKQFKRYVSQQEAFYRNLRNRIQQGGQPLFQIEYRQLSDPDSINQLLEYIGVASPYELKAGTRKQNPEKSADRIINYSELIYEFKNTEYEKYLK